MEGSQTREVRAGKSLETCPQEHFVSPESPTVRAGKALKDYPFLPHREEGKLRPRRVGRVQGHTGGGARPSYNPISRGPAGGFVVHVPVVLEPRGWPSPSGVTPLAQQASLRE